MPLSLFPFLVACLSAAQSGGPKFDGARAFEHIRQLVAIGPRVAGSPGAQRARDYITKEITALGLRVEPQAFDTTTPLGPAKMVNLRVPIPASADLRGPRVIVAGHYDTKLFREFTFLGANDGGSSAAFLIELAHILKDRPLTMSVELLFLDGEEAVVEWQDNDHTYGSRHYVQEARRNGTLKNLGALILVDMIGDRDLRIMRESNSTPWLTDIVWSAARRLKRPEFVDQSTPIEDDHIPFLRAGVPAVDIIDLDYAAWHDAGDTLDKVSAASLQAVGDVVLAALPEVVRRIDR